MRSYYSVSWKPICGLRAKSSTMSNESTPTVKSTERSLRIIETIRELDGADVKTLSSELEIPKSTIYTHLNTLQNSGYLVKSNSTYRLSLRFLELGEYSRSRRRLYEVAGTELTELAEATGEVVILAVEENGEAVCLDVARGSNAIRHETGAGRRMPMYCTGVGKSILAFLSEEHRRSILDQVDLSKRTPHTISQIDELETELDTIRDRGFAFDEEEYHRGLRCVAMPIRSERDNVLGAISVSGPTSRMEGERMREGIPEAMREAINIIEVNMSQTPLT